MQSQIRRLRVQQPRSVTQALEFALAINELSALYGISLEVANMQFGIDEAGTIDLEYKDMVRLILAYHADGALEGTPPDEIVQFANQRGI